MKLLVLLLVAMFVTGCVSVGPLSSTAPSGAAATAAAIASTGPTDTRRPCGPGDTRRRCRTPAPAGTDAATVPPTDQPTDAPTAPPTTMTTLPPLAPACPCDGTGTATDLMISGLLIDFGSVAVSSTGEASVTLTNTGGDPFGPINIFGGAPPTTEFNASQNCQATTLPAGGSCMVSYTFSPGAAGSFNDVSSFTVSETASQADGEDFSVALWGVGTMP